MIKYVCTHDYRSIKQGDICEVEIGKYQVYITYNGKCHGTNEFVLAMNFESM